MKYVAATLIGILGSTIALAWIVIPAYHQWGYISFVCQEIEVPNSWIGFEHHAGYDKEQEFYWSEISHTKEFKIRLLSELGRNAGGYGEDNEYMPVIEFKNLITPNTSPEDDRLVIAIRAQFLSEPYEEVPTDLKVEIQAAAKVFVDMIGERGIPAETVGEAFIRNPPSPRRDYLQRIGYKVVLCFLVSCAFVAYVSSRLNRSPSKVLDSIGASCAGPDRVS